MIFFTGIAYVYKSFPYVGHEPILCENEQKLYFLIDSFEISDYLRIVYEFRQPYNLN